ncbi:hypothetical protein [Candidatus Rhabdochlamydia sp. W815]|nr:hypothetical protein [Candidatus Rhabdochlamydia sp. W815]
MFVDNLLNASIGVSKLRAFLGLLFSIIFFPSMKGALYKAILP